MNSSKTRSNTLAKDQKQKRFKSQSVAQVSIDYLIMITFVLVFVVAVAVIVTVIANISSQAILEVLNVREKVISSLMA